MTYVTSVGLVTPKPGDFRALDVETSLGLNYSSQKSYGAKLQFFSWNFSSFDANTHCLARQEVRLLNEKLTYSVPFFFF
jgi:hypothetical protein